MSEAIPQMRNATREIGQEFTREKYLSFELDGEIYAVDTHRVQEIRGWVPATVMPSTPDYVRGVTNLRGIVIPVIDMRKRFNLNEAGYTAATVAIVISDTVVIVISEGKGELGRRVGIVVDTVSDVLDISSEDINFSPGFGVKVNTEYIKGLVTVDEQMVMLLDVERIFSTSEHDELDSLEARPMQAIKGKE